MLHDLVHGDLRAAVHDNLFLVVCGPLLVALVVHGRASRAPGGPALSPRVAQGLAGAAAAWTLLRNLPRWPLRPVVRKSAATQAP